jgi:outer membrane protein TolC
MTVLLTLAPAMPAQQPGAPTTPNPTPNGGWTSGLRGYVQRYQAQEIAPIDLRNSTRLDSLLRAGKIYLSLQDAISLALENNLDIEIQRYGPRLAEAELQRARAGGLLRGIPTQLNQGSTAAQSAQGGSTLGSGSATSFRSTSEAGSAGGAVFSTSGSAIPNLETYAFATYQFSHSTQIQANSFSSGIPATVTNRHSPNFGVQRQFLTGTTATLGWNNSHILTNIPRAEINPFTTSNVNFQIQQRLLQGFGLAVNNRNIRIARNEITVADLVFRQQVIQTVSSVINLYWDLVSFNEDVRVKKQALTLAEKLLSDNRKQVEIGTLAPIEIVRAEAEVARTQQDLTISETVLLQQETLVKNALSRTGTSSPLLAEARIVPTDSIRLPDEEKIEPIQDLVAAALQKRPDIEQTRVSIENTKIGILGSKSALRPSLDLVGTLQNNGLAGAINSVPVPGITPEIPFVRVANPSFLGGYGSVLNQIFTRNYPDYSVALQLSIPISNRQARADLLNDQLRLRQQELREQQQVNSMRVDIQNALIAVQQARARYQSSVKARVFAEQTLDAEQKKYALGASTIFLVVQAQRDLALAQGAEVAALSTYARARVQLDFATGRTLEANNIVMDEAKRGQVSRPPATPPTP